VEDFQEATEAARPPADAFVLKLEGPFGTSHLPEVEGRWRTASSLLENRAFMVDLAAATSSCVFGRGLVSAQTHDSVTGADAGASHREMPGHIFNPKDLHKLEDPARLVSMPPEDVVRILGLTSGLHVADVGAGSGFFAIPFARAIGPARLFAVDLQTEMLEILRAKLAQPGAPRNIELVLGAASATHLATASCDLVFLGNVWHELDDRPAALREAARILAPGGRVAILDWRADRPQPPGPPVEHRIAAGEAASTLTSAGWTVSKTADIGQYSYLIVAAPPSA